MKYHENVLFEVQLILSVISHGVGVASQTAVVVHLSWLQHSARAWSM